MSRAQSQAAQMAPNNGIQMPYYMYATLALPHSGSLMDKLPVCIWQPAVLTCTFR